MQNIWVNSITWMLLTSVLCEEIITPQAWALAPSSSFAERTHDPIKAKKLKDRARDLATIIKMPEGSEVEQALWDFAHQPISRHAVTTMSGDSWGPILEAAYEGGLEDQLIPPIVRVDADGKPVGRIIDGDSMIFLNFRTDRAKPMTYALTGAKTYEGLQGGLETDVPHPQDIHFVMMTMYDDAFRDRSFVAFKPPPVSNTYAEVIHRHGYREARFMESEKWRAGTWFLDGRRNLDFDQLGIKIHVIPSPKKASYVAAPEMSAHALTDEVIKDVNGDNVTDIFINYANPDMVSHAFAQINPKGDVEAVVKAIETVDQELARWVDAARRKGWVIAITADHGNAEELWDAKEDKPMPSHTTNKVPFILISDDPNLQRLKLREDGSLANIAPTLLELRGLDKPLEMNQVSLFTSDVKPDPDRKIIRIILDGWGLRDALDHNAIAIARQRAGGKLNMDRWWDQFPHVALEASGPQTGYPKGVAGTTEFGHVNLDAGRQLESDLSLINQAIDNGSFVKNPALRAAMENAKAKGKSLHLMGLVSRGTKGDIHASMDHLFILLEMAKEVGLRQDQVKIHVFTDGRDSPPQAGAKFIVELEQRMEELGIGEIVDVMGRGWAMDRDNRWKRLSSAYDALVGGEAAFYVQFASGRAAPKMRDEIAKESRVLSTSS